jgi:hypothetical protein
VNYEARADQCHRVADPSAQTTTGVSRGQILTLRNLIMCFSAVTMLAACQSRTASNGNDKSDAKPLAALPTSRNSPKPVPSIKDLHLGDAVASLKSKFSTAECKPEADGSVICQVNGVGYGGSSTGVIWSHFADDKLVGVVVYGLEPDKFDEIVSAMTTRFGSADDSQHKPAIASSRDVTWSGDHWLLGASPAADEHTFALVMLYDTDYLTKVRDQKNQKAVSNL